MVDFATKRFPVFIFSYFVLQIFIRLATTHIAVLDESEQVMLSQYFAWGYNEQPPLYTWMQMGIFKIFGVSIFGLSLLKNTLLFLTYFFVYRLGLLLTNDTLRSSLGALSLFLLPQMVWDAQVDQTHTVFLTSMTSAVLYLFFYMIKVKNSWVQFVLFGIVSGIGLLAKYNFVLVLFGLGVSALVIPAYRQRFFRPALLFSIVIAFCITLPHFFWFLTHLQTATQRTIERMSTGQSASRIMNFLIGNMSLVLAYIGFLSPFWLFFVGFFRKHFSWKNNDQIKAFMILFTVIFVCLFAIITLSGSTHVKERWLQPYLVIVPMFLFLHVKSLENLKTYRYYIATLFVVPLIVASVVLIRPWLIDVRGKPTRASYPFEQIAQEIRSQIPQNEPVLIYAEDKYIGGNLKLLIPNAEVITPSLPNQPYSLKPFVIFFWEQDNPKIFKEMLLTRGYNCKFFSKQFFHKKSKKITYTISYEVCKAHEEDK